MTLHSFKPWHLGTLLVALLCTSPLWAESIQIDAAKMTILHKENRAIFKGNVHLTRSTFELYCDRLDAYYTDHALDHAVATGHVRIQQEKTRGRADTAVMNQAKNQLTLSGHAVLEQDGNIVKGETIVHDISGKRTTVHPSKTGRIHMIIQSDNKQGSK